MDIRNIQTRSLRKLIGVVPQEPFILNDTLRANINPDGQLSDEQIYEICEQVSLDTLIKQLPDGLNTLMLERGQNLSGGEKQRVVLARMLARGNKVMILDEVTSALDAATELSIIRTIQSLRRLKGITIIEVSHRLELARNSDRIFVLEEGRVVEEGSHKELLERGGRYNTFYLKSKEYNKYEKKSHTIS